MLKKKNTENYEAMIRDGGRKRPSRRKTQKARDDERFDGRCRVWNERDGWRLGGGCSDTRYLPEGTVRVRLPLG